MKKEQRIFKYEQIHFLKESNVTSEKDNSADGLEAYQVQLKREFVKWKPYMKWFPRSR